MTFYIEIFFETKNCSRENRAKKKRKGNNHDKMTFIKVVEWFHKKNVLVFL